MYEFNDFQEDLKITAILGGALVAMGGIFLFAIAYAGSERSRAAEANRQQAINFQGQFAEARREQLELQQYELRIRERAAKKADANNDGKVSTEEWKAVYAKLGIPFNESAPKELSTSDLEKFLASK